MENVSKDGIPDFMEKRKSSYYRFGDLELREQKDAVAVYILTELSNDSIASINEGINEVKRLTGYDLNLDSALLIRRLARELKDKTLNEDKSNSYNAVK